MFALKMNEKYFSRGTNSIGLIICTGRISKYLEKEHFERFSNWKVEVFNGWRLSNWAEKNLVVETMKQWRWQNWKKWNRKVGIMEVFVQEFRRATKGSGYKRWILIKEFKKGMNRVIRQKLIDSEWPPRNIE